MSQALGETLSPVEKILCLQRVDVFKYATTEMLGYISSIAEETSLPPDSTLFAEEEISDAMYVVVTGHVRIAKEGHEVLVVGPSESVGTWALFDNAPRIMTATTVDETLALRISKDSFYELLADHEEITPMIFRALIERVKGLAPESL